MSETTSESPAHEASATTAADGPRKSRAGWRWVAAIGLALVLGGLGLAAWAEYLRQVRVEQRVRRDEQGRVLEVTDGTGWLARTTYDEAGNPTRIERHRLGRWTGHEYASSSSVRLEYGPLGRRTSMSDELGRWRYEYDLAQRLSRVLLPDGRGIAMKYAPWGHLLSVELPGGGRLGYGYDALGRPTSAEGAGGTTKWQYGPDAGLLSRELPCGVRTSIRVDERGQTRSIEHKSVKGEPLLALRYEYDASGRVTLAEERWGTSTSETRYDYDALGRLLRAQGPAGQLQEFAYDPAGNRISSKTERGSVSFTYDDQGRLSQSGDTRWEYDGADRVVARSGPGGTVRYQWSPAGYLEEVTTGEHTIRYAYDGDGVRVGRTVDGKSTRLTTLPIGASSRVVLSEGPAGVSTYLLAPSGERLMRDDGGGRTVCYLEDRLGSTRLLVSGEGAPVARYDYDPFGVPRPQGEAPRVSEYLFAGEAWDEEARLLHLGERDYEPETGRFLSPDAKTGQLINPQSLNRYVYAGNDPVNFINPSGLEPQFPEPFESRVRQSMVSSPPPQPSSWDEEHERMMRQLREIRLSYPQVQLFPPDTKPPVMWEPPGIHYSRPSIQPSTTATEMARVATESTMVPTAETMRVPAAHSMWHYFWPMLGKSLTSGEFFYADTPYQQNIRATIRVLEFVPVLNVPMVWLNRALAANDANYYYQHGRALEGTATIVGAAGAESLKWAKNLKVPETATSFWQRAISPAYQNAAETAGNARKAWKLGENVWKGQLLQTVWSKLTKTDEDSPPTYGLIDARGIGGLDPWRTSKFGGGPPPPPPPPPPAVGGVYLDQTLKVLGELGAPVGAVYDREKGQLVLLGDKAVKMPPMRPEYLAEALRAVYTPSREEPGMTIDPNPQDPRAPEMLVRFFANTRETRIGQVMFEADRVMKGLSIGRDNITKTEVKPGVPGYESVTAMGLSNPQPNDGLWSRFWLVPEPVVGRVAADGNAIIMEPIRVRVRTETMRWVGGKLVSAGGKQDAHAEAFARHLTEHYDEYAAAFPIFAELKTVVLAVCLAKFMRERELPIDWDFVNQYAVPFDTPETTPAATNEIEARDGRSIRRIQSFGGVQMAPQLQAKPSSPSDPEFLQIAAAREVAQKSGERHFEMDVGGRKLGGQALELSPRRALGSYRLTADNLDPSSPMVQRYGRLPGLVRHYDSTHNEPTELGRGWSLLMPRLYRESVAAPGQIRFLTMEGVGRVVHERFQLSDQFGLSRERFQKDFVHPGYNRIGFAPESQLSALAGVFPEPDGAYRLIGKTGEQAMFDERGALRALLDTGLKVTYEYAEEGRLRTLRAAREGSGESVVQYGYDGSGRLVSVTSGELATRYDYDQQGNLSAAESGGSKTAYRYDARGLLRVVEEDGRRVVDNQYDDQGALVQQQGPDGAVTSQTIAMNGPTRTVKRVSGRAESEQVFDEKARLIERRIQGGERVRYTYGAQGRVSRIERELPGARHDTMSLDDQGRPQEYTDAAGTRVTLQYGPDENVRAIEVDGRPYLSVSYAAPGVVSQRLYDGGYSEQYRYDEKGRVVESVRVVPGLAPTAVEWERDASGRVVALRTSGGTREALFLNAATAQAGAPKPVIPMVRDGKLVMPGLQGTETEYTIDRGGTLSRVRDAVGGVTQYRYDTSRQLVEARLPTGHCLGWKHDAANHSVVSTGMNRCAK